MKMVVVCGWYLANAFSLWLPRLVVDNRARLTGVPEGSRVQREGNPYRRTTGAIRSLLSPSDAV